MIDTLDESQVKEFIRDMNTNVNIIQTENDSMGRAIEDMAISVVENYRTVYGEDTPNRSETRYKRDLQVAFANTIQSNDRLKVNEKLIENDPIDVVEERIRNSDLLLLNYMLVSNEAYKRAKQTILDSGKDLAEIGNDEIFGIMAKVCVEAIRLQREKHSEDRLYEAFPNAPTNGQELEYEDPLAFISSMHKVVVERISILKQLMLDPNLRYNDLQRSGLQWNMDSHLFLLNMEGSSKETIGIYLDMYEMKLNALEQATKTIERYEVVEYNSADTERDSRIFMFHKWSQSTPEKKDLDNLLQFIGRARPIEKGQQLTADEVLLLGELSPTLTRMMSHSGAFKDINELKGREYISKPTVSIAAQLRDVFNVMMSEGLQGELVVHQTVSGAEISPSNVDFMEAHAILVSSDLALDGTEMTDDQIAEARKFLTENKIFSSETFKKFSSVDGEEYYFPMHLNRGRRASEAVKYTEETHNDNLVEIRVVGLVKKPADFPKYVKSMVFNWLCAWGSKADIQTEESRSDDEQYFADIYNELIEGWRDLLKVRNLYRPDEKEYFCKVSDLGTADHEKYSTYIMNLTLNREQEKNMVAKGEIKYEDTLAFATNKLVIKFRAKMRERINLRLNENGDQ